MLGLALEAEARFAASDLELDRAGPSYTVDTVEEVFARLPAGASLHVVIGTDNLPGLPDWFRVEELLARVHPVVVHREGDPDALVDALEGRLSPEAVARLRRGLLRLPPVPCSSTEVRAALAEGRIPFDDLPPGVGEYIRARNLYGIAP